MALEERVYRLRCVEAWAFVIPWRGFPLRRWIEKLEPLASARYIQFTTFLKPDLAAGQKQRFWEPWPYTEGLTLKEAVHPLSFIATGIYGKELPPQNGAPLRLVVPWKHGFKSIKSIARIEFTQEEPQTFCRPCFPWNTIYGQCRPEGSLRPLGTGIRTGTGKGGTGENKALQRLRRAGGETVFMKTDRIQRRS